MIDSQYIDIKLRPTLKYLIQNQKPNLKPIYQNHAAAAAAAAAAAQQQQKK